VKAAHPLAPRHDGRKFVLFGGRLWNSTIFAAQKLGLKQSSPFFPPNKTNLSSGLIVMAGGQRMGLVLLSNTV
jgi:hypothetical protein